MKYSDRFLRVGMVASPLVIFPANAWASDPTQLMAMFVGFSIFMALVLTSLMFFLTRKLKAKQIKLLLRIVPASLFLAPAPAGELGNLWPALVVFVVGGPNEVARAAGSVLASICALYFLFTLLSKSRGSGKTKDTHQES